MNSKLIKEAISQIIETIKEQMEIINQNDGRIAQIELDLIMSNIRKLYDKFYLLNKMNSDLIVFSDNEKQKSADIKEIFVEPTKTKVEKLDEIIQKIEKTEDSKKPSQKTDEKTEINSSIVANSEKKPGEKKIIVKEIDFFEEETIIAPPKKNIESQPVFDLFSINEESIADRFIKENDNSIAAKITKKKTSDLKSIIGINEKFLFINELFNGNMQDYNEAVNSLNSFTDHEEANNFIESLKQSNNWDNDLHAFKILNDFVVQIFN
ncbi:MAG: hypothetical protein JEY97_16055 [Bacteroidales bacterium]|nr:hypothetical protein [Bacteroidales bacterium]